MEKQKQNKNIETYQEEGLFSVKKREESQFGSKVMTVANVFKMCFLANSRHYSICNGMFVMYQFR